jgi:hypothetical protein
MAWRARVGCVLLAPCLVAARPMAQSNAPVPLSHELSRTRRALTGYVMDDSTIRTAVTAWFDDRSGAEATYGHISAWETGVVTEMSWLFCASSYDYSGYGYCNTAASSFNDDISAWDTSGVTTMSDITDSSRKIADIIGVIDGIAFQTNILALNAAVEAARAGDQGRGFAVGAGEVRALAQRSANAAKEIKTLIGASVERVESGARRVDEAGRTMEDIVTQVKRVSDLIAEISSSTAEQSTGVAQVDQAVVHLDNITQQNAALVEQSTAASESLRQQATRLVDAVNVFR